MVAEKIEMFWGKTFPLTAQPTQILFGLDLEKSRAVQEEAPSN
jgi:hypothetical protein